METELFELLDQIGIGPDRACMEKIESTYERLSPTLTDEQRVLVRQIEDTWADIVGAVQLATAKKFLNSRHV